MIDVHAHYQPMSKAAWWPVKAAGDDGIMRGNVATKIGKGIFDLAAQIADMDARGIEVRAVGVNPGNLHYELPAAEGVRYCKEANDIMARDISKYPGRFAGLAALPMQSPKDVPAEQERVMKDLGFRGAFIGSNVLSVPLDDPRYSGFWQKASDLGATILIQSTNQAGSDRMKDMPYLANMMASRFEIALCGARMIFAGFPSKFPGAKIILGQGGGYLAMSPGRMDHAWEIMPDSQKPLKERPSSFLRYFYYDTLLQNGKEVNFLISVVGADRVGIGTDAPYDMGDPNPNKSVKVWIQDTAVLNQVLFDSGRKILGLQM